MYAPDGVFCKAYVVLLQACVQAHNSSDFHASFVSYCERKYQAFDDMRYRLVCFIPQVSTTSYELMHFADKGVDHYRGFILSSNAVRIGVLAPVLRPYSQVRMFRPGMASVLRRRIVILIPAMTTLNYTHCLLLIYYNVLKSPSGGVSTYWTPFSSTRAKSGKGVESVLFSKITGTPLINPNTLATVWKLLQGNVLFSCCNADLHFSTSSFNSIISSG